MKNEVDWEWESAHLQRCRRVIHPHRGRWPPSARDRSPVRRKRRRSPYPPETARSTPAPTRPFLRFTFEVVQAQPSRAITQGFGNCDLYPFRIGLHDALEEGFEGLRRGVVDKVLYDGDIASANSSGDRSSKNRQISYSSLMPHNGVNAVAISGL